MSKQKANYNLGTEYNLDDPMTTMSHYEILQKNRFLNRLYRDWYSYFIKESQAVPSKGIFLEIGSGGGFLKSMYPEVVTSDILDLPIVDKVCSAENLPFEDESIASIMMLNVFHHIPRPYLFLQEAQRTLVKHGKIIMIEPANSVLSRYIYKNYHHEPFDPSGEMEIEPGNPLSNSNQALPYIYFEREREKFNKEYPLLEIKKLRYHTPLRYAISGGFSKKPMLPYFMYYPIKFTELILSPLSKKLGLFCSIVIEKK